MVAWKWVSELALGSCANLPWRGLTVIVCLVLRVRLFIPVAMEELLEHDLSSTAAWCRWLEDMAQVISHRQVTHQGHTQCTRRPFNTRSPQTKSSSHFFQQKNQSREDAEAQWPLSFQQLLGYFRASNLQLLSLKRARPHRLASFYRWSTDRLGEVHLMTL